jgi:hypothetical protein
MLLREIKVNMQIGYNASMGPKGGLSEDVNGILY